MIAVTYSEAALVDLERLVEFLHEDGSRDATEALREVLQAVRMLQRHPYIGRTVRKGVRELIISYGRTGYVASYRVTETAVEVLRVRHQREAGVRP